MVAVHIRGRIDEALRIYAEEHCLNVSKWVHKLVKQELEKNGVKIND